MVFLQDVFVMGSFWPHACSPRYSGDRDCKDHSSRLARAKQVCEISSQPMAECSIVCLSSQWHQETQTELCSDQQGHKQDLILKITNAKMAVWVAPVRRVPA
jgi:hypothetical protein